MKEGSLIEIVDPGEEIRNNDGKLVGIMTFGKIPVQIAEKHEFPNDKFSFQKFRSHEIKTGTIGLFVGVSGPFDEPLVLINDKTYVVSRKYIKVLTHENWVASQNKQRK